jgi:hypothetical protein
MGDFKRWLMSGSPALPFFFGYQRNPNTYLSNSFRCPKRSRNSFVQSFDFGDLKNWPTELNGKPTAKIKESKPKYRVETHRANMGTPSDPYVNPQGELNRHRVEFIKSELALCFTFSSIAVRKDETGNREAAEKFMAYAEEAYETVLHFLSDSKHFTDLAGEEIEAMRTELDRLRERLDRIEGI